MKPMAFDYLRAETLEEALEALDQDGEDARLLAGGQSLVAMLNLRLVKPAVLIDISRLDALGYIREEGGMIEVGATTTQADLQRWPELAEKVPLLALVLPHVGHYQTRNQGTVCGSIAHADPSSELPLALAVLGGEVELRSARGRRTLPAAEFLCGMLSTARRPDEMIVAVRFPRRGRGEGFAFTEMTRRHGDLAIVAVAVKASRDAIHIGIGGVADRPTVRALPVRADGAYDDDLNAFAWALDAADDMHGSARYRRELVRRLGRRMIEEALSCRD